MRGQLNDEGIWISPHPGKGPRRPGLLMDRDGVLVREVNYLRRKEDVELEAGVCELLRWARGEGIPTVIITNQAGIARGYYDWAAFENVDEELAAKLARQGCAIDLVLACPFHPDHTAGYGERHAYWRKPGSGMLELAAGMLNLDLKRSCMIGDTDTDIGAAKAAGLPMAVHLLSGHGRATRQAAMQYANGNFRIVPAHSLVEALSDLEEFFRARQLAARASTDTLAGRGAVS